MDNQSFTHLAEEAAAGLKSDRELFLDITQELTGHMEEKAAKFTREGHSAEESAELAKKAFGSPLDVAAQLLAENKRRMRSRALLRLAFGALIVPLAIVLALYIGYGRIARSWSAMLVVTPQSPPFPARPLPALPFLDDQIPKTEQAKELFEVGRGHDRAESARQYWEKHQGEPGSEVYYAYFADFYETDRESDYVNAMRQGEQIEPDNALYNALLAQFYFHRGIEVEQYKKKGETFHKYKVLDRRYMDLGIAELQRGIKKPYLQGYQLLVARKRLNALPQPLFTEDYIQRIAIQAAELFPVMGRLREVSTIIPASADVLIREGKTAQAEGLLDTWRPFTTLLAGNDKSVLISELVALSSGANLTEESALLYDRLGASRKAEEARQMHTKLVAVKENWRAVRLPNQATPIELHSHASYLVGMLAPVFGGSGPTIDQLKPARMGEHALIEEGVIQVTLLLLTFCLIGVLFQGAVALYRNRRSAAVPLLLLPPFRVTARVVTLGVLLPVAVYWIYSRLPIIGGREYGWGTWMALRFGAELAALLFVLLWLSPKLISRYIRQRCDDLEIPMPDSVKERKAIWIKRVWGIASLAAASTLLFIPLAEHTAFEMEFTVRMLGVGILVAYVVVIGVQSILKRREFPLYYGTLARSLAPVYAFSIIALSLIVQPWLMFNEAKSLRQDPLIFGYLASTDEQAVTCSSMEAKASQRMHDMIIQALEDQHGK